MNDPCKFNLLIILFYKKEQFLHVVTWKLQNLKFMSFKMDGVFLFLNLDERMYVRNSDEELFMYI